MKITPLAGPSSKEKVVKTQECDKFKPLPANVNNKFKVLDKK